MSDVKLYDRNPAYIPRVAAVHDMCGYGKRKPTVPNESRGYE